MDGGNSRDGSPFLHDMHHPLPEIGKGLILLGPHLGTHLLIELCRHLCEKETLVKKREGKEKSKSVTNQITLTLLFDFNGV